MAADPHGRAQAESRSVTQPRDGRSEVRLFMGVFLFVGMAATLLGMAAPAALSLPAIRQGLGLEPIEETSGAWGEVRYIHVGTRVRAARTTESETVASLAPGDSVRVDFGANDWYAVFPVGAEERDETDALGYVYGPLLKPKPYVLAAGILR